MNPIEFSLATMADYPLLKRINLDFDSNYVWQSQMNDDVNEYSITLKNVKLPKTIHVPFQANDENNLEMTIKLNEIILIRTDRQEIGFIRIEQDELAHRIILRNGGLKPEYRRQGIGTIMLGQIEEIARQNNITQILCIIQAKNDSAIRFLTAKGFRLSGFEEFYFPNMEIALFFSKNIH